MTELSPRHHPKETTLLDFASGAIEERLREIVRVHLGFCAACREDVSLLEEAGGTMLLTLSPEVAATDARVARAIDSLVGVTVDPNKLAVDPRVGPTTRALSVDFDTGGWAPLRDGAQYIAIAWPERTRALLIARAIPSLVLEGKLRPNRGMTVLRGELTSGPQSYGRGDYVPPGVPLAVGAFSECIFVLGVARTRSTLPQGAAAVS